MIIKPKYLIGTAVFLVSFSVLLLTVSDYGLTWDEPYYIAHSNRLQQWFGLLIHNQSPFSEDSVNNLVQFDRLHNCHPPFYKLSGMFFKNVLGKYIYLNVLYQYRVSAVFWSALLVTVFFFYLYRAYQRPVIAIMGAGLLFTTPRFFAHMHLFTTDVIIVSLYFSALYLFVFGKRTVSAIFGGLLGGALLASKFTGVLLFPILLLMAPCLGDRKFFKRRLILFISASCIIFIIFDIHLWVGFFQELFFYFGSVLDREAITTIGTLFFGKIYGYRLPWFQPFVMLAICIPFACIVFAFVSPLYGRFDLDRKFWLFEILPLLFLLIVFSLPKTPKHDGIRLFSLSWPHLILLSVRGICGISHVVERYLIHRIITPQSIIAARLHTIVISMLLVLTLMTNLYSLICYHPYQLSFYNALIGGPSGAQKKGFTISYWYDALNQDFLKILNTMPDKNPVAIYSFPNTVMLEYNRALGLLNPKIQTVSSPQEADYLLVLNRILSKQMINSLQGKQTASSVVTPDNVWILSLLKNDENHR